MARDLKIPTLSVTRGNPGRLHQGTRGIPRDAAMGPPPRNAPAKPAANGFQAVLNDLDRQQDKLDRMIAQSAKMQIDNGPRLLALQAQLYVYNQNLELTSRVVDRTLSAVKTTLNIQV